MAVVLEQKIGHTTIRIHDDYCRNATRDRVNVILNRIASRVLTELNTDRKEIFNGVEEAAL